LLANAANASNACSLGEPGRARERFRDALMGFEVFVTLPLVRPTRIYQRGLTPQLIGDA
jgi:hypothetical protein